MLPTTSLTLRLQLEVADEPVPGRNALATAARHGHLQVVHYLLEQVSVHGASWIVPDSYLACLQHTFLAASWYSTLAQVAGTGHVDVLQLLLDTLPCFGNRQNMLFNAACEAATAGQQRVLKRILAAGPLFAADEQVRLLGRLVTAANLPLLQWLWDRWAGALRTKASASSASRLIRRLSVASRRGDRLQAACQAAGLLNLASRTDDPAIMAWLVHEVGMDVNARHGTRGRTPLHTACANGKVAMVQWLLQYTAADMTAVDSSNATPLHMACGRGCLETCQWLIGCGASLVARDSQNRTPVGSCYSPPLSKYLETAKRWPPVMMAADSRNMNLFIDNCRTGFYFTQRRLARSLLQRHLAESNVTGIPIHAGMQATVQAFLNPWEPSAHYLYPRGMHVLALAVMLVADFFEQADGKGSAARQRGGTSRWLLWSTPDADNTDHADMSDALACSSVPGEIWLRVLASLPPERYYDPKGPRTLAGSGLA